MASWSAIICHQESEKHRMYSRQPHFLVGPWRASNRTPEQSSGRSRATCGNRITRMAPTIQGRIDEGIFKFVRHLYSWRGCTTSSNSSFRASSSKNLLRANQEESTMYPAMFPKTRIANYADARKLRERHAGEFLTIARTELRLPRDLGIC